MPDHIIIRHAEDGPGFALALDRIMVMTW
jgi:hypothetical protein